MNRRAFIKTSAGVFIPTIVGLAQVPNTVIDPAFLGRRRVTSNSIDPSTLANKEGWWKADAITGKVNNDPISSWVDSSGNSRPQTQGTPGAQPLYKTNIQNGLPGVRFDATDDALSQTGCFLGAQDYTIFSCHLFHDMTTNHRAVCGGAVGGLANYSIGNNTSTHWVYPGCGPGLLGFAGTANVAVVMTHRRKDLGGAGYEEALWQNGTYVGAGICNGFARSPTLGLSPFGEVSDSDIFEVICFSVALTDTQVVGVCNWLKTKWGVS